MLHGALPTVPSAATLEVRRVQPRRAAFAPSGGTGRIGKDALFNALIQQESGGRAGAVGQQTQYGVPKGAGQMLEPTAREMARKLGVPWRPDLYSGASKEALDYQLKLSRAYLDEGMTKTGNVRDALHYYHGGPDRGIWGPKTRRYANEVLARIGVR